MQLIWQPISHSEGPCARVDFERWLFDLINNIVCRQLICLRQVAWHAASALSPASYRNLLHGRTAVVHTVGTLLEAAQYKEAIRSGDLGGLAKTVFGSLAGSDGSNPLKRGASHPASYETLNRDTGTHTDASRITRLTLLNA